VWAPDLETSPKGLDPIGKTSQTGATFRGGSPDSVVSHLDDQSSRVSLEFDHRRGCPGVSSDIGQGLTYDIEGGQLDRLGHPVLDGPDHFNRHGGTSRHRLESDSQTVVTHCSRMEAVSQVAKLRQAGRHFLPGGVHPLPYLGVAVQPIP
jgi:hypothetical protein